MINILYNTVLTALNKNQMGKISPSEYNSALAQVLNKLYSEIFSDFRKLSYRKMRFQDTPGYGNESFNIKQVIEFYIKSEELSINNNICALPEDCYLLISVGNDDVQFEKVDIKTFTQLKRSRKSKPTKCSPIITLDDSGINVFPGFEDIELSYFRKIKLPKWTYVIVNNVEMFNPDANDFQDIDMHPLMISRIFTDLLAIFGLNLQNDQVTQYVNMMKQEDMVNKQ